MDCVATPPSFKWQIVIDRIIIAQIESPHKPSATIIAHLVDQHIHEILKKVELRRAGGGQPLEISGFYYKNLCYDPEHKTSAPVHSDDN